jgi:archaellum component FlaG (FlaF/FlaG flagellin family)
MMAFLARPIAKWLIAGVVAAVLAGAVVYLTGALRQAGRDAERADQNARTIQRQETINDADARGPRTPDAVDRRLRDGNF